MTIALLMGCVQREGERKQVLRITKVSHHSSRVTLKIEGQIASDWVAELENECLRLLEHHRTVALDFAGVTFIDNGGIAMLNRIATGNLKIINCPALIKDLLRLGRNECN